MPLSPDTAANLYNISRILLLLAACLGTLGTVGLFWSTPGRDTHLTAQYKDDLSAAQSLATKWEGEATLALRQLARLDPQPSGAPRTLSDEQRKNLIANLKFLAKSPLRIAHLRGNLETTAFASTLGKACTEAGYLVTLLEVDTLSANSTGLTMIISSGTTPPDSSLELLGTLQAIGIPTTGISNNNPDPPAAK
jgi:hypothetical protein